jgi:hypothetical protein
MHGYLERRDFRSMETSEILNLRSGIEPQTDGLQIYERLKFLSRLIQKL